MNLCHAIFSRPVEAKTLGLFRVMWGVALLLSAASLFKWQSNFFSPSFAHFRYFGFEWVPIPQSESIVLFEIVTLCVLAVGVITGIAFRYSLAGFVLIYAHLFLIEAVWFNNHYYLIILISILLCFTKADLYFNVLSWIKKRAEKPVIEPVKIPVWNYSILRAQVIVVYFCGGLLKLNPDWLRGEPFRTFLQVYGITRWPFTSVAKSEWFVYFVSWSGIAIDLICPFLLLFRKTRWISIGVLIMFHLCNSRLFAIGWFPVVGIILLIPFLDPRLNVWKKSKFVSSPSESISGFKWSACGIFLGIFFLLQLILPIRFLVSGGEPSWTEVGQKFSWRMMHRHKEAELHFLYQPREAAAWLYRNPSKMPKNFFDQNNSMKTHPWQILQYVRWLDRVLTENGFPDTQIKVISVVSLNRIPFQVMIDPTADLTEVSYSDLRCPDWIAPFDPNLRKEPMLPLVLSSKRLEIEKALERYFKKNPEKEILHRNFMN